MAEMHWRNKLNAIDTMVLLNWKVSVNPCQGALVSHLDKLVHYLSDTTYSVDCSSVWCFPSLGQGESALEWSERPRPDTQTLLFQCSSPLAKKLSAHILSFSLTQYIFPLSLVSCWEPLSHGPLSLSIHSSAIDPMQGLDRSLHIWFWVVVFFFIMLNPVMKLSFHARFYAEFVGLKENNMHPILSLNPAALVAPVHFTCCCSFFCSFMA